MSSTLFVDAIEPNLSSGVHIAGHVVQVQYHTSSTVVSYAGGSFQSFNMSKAFTPKFATSKILMIATLSGEHYNYSDLGISFGIYKNASLVYNSQYTGYLSTDTSQNISQYTFQYWDTATNTNAITYEIMFAPSNPSGTARVNQYGKPSYMTLMEIAQ